MILFFDTETTGKSRDSHLVQLGAILVDDDFSEKALIKILVKPDGFTIPEDVAQFHGISQEIASRSGVRLRAACSIFYSLTLQARRLVAHNLDYDLGIMDTAFRAVNAGKDYHNPHTDYYCTMKRATTICRIPNPYPQYGPFKWPTLSEAYAHFHDGAKFEGAHDALNDVRACIAVYKKLEGISA
jgi:DNA polymerase III subunit epsilon